MSRNRIAGLKNLFLIRLELRSSYLSFPGFIRIFLEILPDPAKEACDSADKMILFNYVNIKGNNIGGRLDIFTKEECAEECFRTENCKAFTWASKLHHAKGCYLKTSQGFRHRFFNLSEVSRYKFLGTL